MSKVHIDHITTGKFKTIGTYHDISVIAVLPLNPVDEGYCFCKVNGKPITCEVITFSRESWDNPAVMHACFAAAAGVGLSIFLESQETAE